MRLVFAGTPEFAVPCLHALHAAGHEIAAVYTQPDRPAGRGRQPQESAVKLAARALQIPVRQPLSLKPAEQAEALRALDPVVMVVVAYGLILPTSVLAIPVLGCLNVHASLLPRWRGAAPIQRAIEAGDTHSGVTLMQMAAGLDTGDMLAQIETPITETDTGGSLHDRLADLGARLLVENLPRLAAGELRARAQNDAAACYAAKLSKQEARIDWHADATLLARRVRAFNPWPVAHTRWDGKGLLIWSASAESTPGADTPGTVLAADTNGILVRCGRGALRVTRLQREGGRAVGVADFLNGHALTAGTRLGDNA